MRKHNKHQFIFLIIFFFLSIDCTYSQRDYFIRYLNYGKLAHGSHDLEGALNLLNLWEEQPNGIQEVYAEAFNQLSRHFRASFTDVAFPDQKLRTGKSFLQ